VMSHDAKWIRLKVYDCSFASTRVPSAGIILPYGPSSPHLPRRSPSYPPEKDEVLAIARPILPSRVLDLYGDNETK